MNSIGPNSANNGTNSNHVEERLLLLESEVKFWRRKFEELEKWRSCLDEWIQGTFGFNIRTNSHGSFPAGSKGSNNIGDSRFSSPHNSGWSPDSPDTIVRPSSGINLPDNNASGKREMDYVDAEEDEKFFSGKPGSVPKRKRGRPKKNALGGGAPTGGGQDSSLDGSEIAPWENTSAAAQMKRGRGRPRKIRINSEEMASDGGESTSKGSKKKPTTPTLKTCDVCMLECDSNQDLIAHKRAVHPERLYTCNICHETYLHPGFLARHMETHTMERNFRCQMCISSFNTYHLLKLHVAEKHGMDLGRQPDWKQNPSECRSMESPDFSGAGISDRYNNAQQQQHPNSLPMSPHSMVPPQQQPQAPSSMGNGSDYNNEALRASSHMDMPQMQQQQQQHNLMHQQMRHQHPGMMHHQQHMSQQMSSSQMMSLQHQSNPGNHHSMQQSHDGMGQQQQQQQHHQQQYHHHQIKDELGDEVDSDGFPLDFDAPVSESLPSMFGNNSNNVGMNAYNMNNMNSMGSDPLHMF